MKNSIYFPLVPMQINKNNFAPVFLIPGAGGSVVGFMELIDSLKLPNSIYGFQPRGVDGMEPPHKSVCESVQCYLQEINKFPIAQPIHLLGHSFGGWIALELGFQLSKIGRKIESLTIIDSDVPNKKEATPIPTQANVFKNYAEALEQIIEGDLGISHEDLVPLNYFECLNLVHKKAVEFRIMPKRSEPRALSGSIATFAECLSIPYAPNFVYPNPTFLIFMENKKMNIEENKKRQVNLVDGWKEITPKLIFWRGPGNHMSALRAPHVHVVADWLRSIFSSQIPG